MVNFVALAREHWVNILVPMGFVIGWYLDKQQDQKLTAFRNKSVLFSSYDDEFCNFMHKDVLNYKSAEYKYHVCQLLGIRELKPGEEVTWK